MARSDDWTNSLGALLTGSAAGATPADGAGLASAVGPGISGADDDDEQATSRALDSAARDTPTVNRVDLSMNAYNPLPNIPSPHCRVQY